MSNFGRRLAASTSSRTSAFSNSWRHPKRAQWATRNVHERKQLPYNIEEGLGDFLPPPALKTVAVDFQEGLLKNLDDELRQTDDKRASVAQTVINTALDRSRTKAFNYASQALNNSFFLDMLTPPPPLPATTHEGAITRQLLNAINSQHGDLVQFKSTFGSAAHGMASSGWVWFVTDKKGETAVLPTFGAGTLLTKARTQREANVLGEKVEAVSNDASRPSNKKAPSQSGTTTRSPASGLSYSPATPNLQPHTRIFHRTPSQAYDPMMSADPSSLYGSSPGLEKTLSLGKVEILNLGETLYPLFCVSVHEHAWMSAGYGVWGKEEWLKKFWTVLNWEKVSTLFATFAEDKSSF